MHGDGMRKFLRRLQEQREAMAKMVEPYLESLRVIKVRLEPYRKMAEVIRQRFEDLNRATEPMRKVIADIQARFEPMRDMMRHFIEQHQALKEDYRLAQKYLFEKGWYLGSDMPLPSYAKLSEMVADGRNDGIEDAMCDWARARTDEIADGACKAFPNREELITDAIDAHREGKYTLSIPVLFAQSDGMAKEIIGNCLFRGNAPRALEKTMSQFGKFQPGGFSDILLDPLRSHSCFYTCSTRKGSKGGPSLANRSEVMHGIQLDYASEANSLRTIVLLGYLVGVKSLLESHSEEVRELREAMDEVFSSDMDVDGSATDETDGEEKPESEGENDDSAAV